MYLEKDNKIKNKSKAYTTMKELLKKYEEKEPEIVFHWKDQQRRRAGLLLIHFAAVLLEEEPECV